MTNQLKAQKNVPCDSQTLIDSIDLQEKMPVNHDRAGDCRYGHTGPTGEGRFDWMTLRLVPQHLVEAAMQKEPQK